MSFQSRSIRLAPLVLLLGLSAACAGLMMSVEEKAGDASLSLAKGTQVAVATPTVVNALSEEIAGAFDSTEEFAEEVQKAVIAALIANGVVATKGDEAPGGVIEVRITDFERGSGAARAFLGGGFGDSHLAGEAVLRTPAGRREVTVTKTGSQSGTSQGGDQSRANVLYFATALADALEPAEG